MSNVERPDIDVIKALADSATPGAWNYDQFNEYVSNHNRKIADVGDNDMTDADGFFIAAARTAVPQMTAYIEALEAELRIASRIAGNLGCETLQLRDKPDDTVVSIGQWTEPVPGWMQVFDAGVALKASDIREAWAFHERWRHLDKDAAGDAR